MSKEQPETGDIILAYWPGQGLKEFAISDIRPAKDGTPCVVFGENSTVGAEAIKDLVLMDGVWQVKVGSQSKIP